MPCSPPMKQDSFDQRIARAIGAAGSVDQVRELILDGARSQTLTSLNPGLTSLFYLSMNGVGLSSFEGMPKLECLKELAASDNRVSGGLEHLVEACPNLARLDLSGNRLREFSDLTCLKQLKDLIVLDLFKCPVSEHPEFRKSVFEMLPNLKMLDGRNEDNEECDESEDDYSGESEFNVEFKWWWWWMRPLKLYIL
ncbi:hypothetical protein ACOME3_000343 [Neoechinorhynchus agilis]